MAKEISIRNKKSSFQKKETEAQKKIKCQVKYKTAIR